MPLARKKLNAGMGPLGRYEVEAELGRGGFGRVVRARHRDTGAIHALKLLHGLAGPEGVARFRREAEALARLGGQGVVGVHEVWCEAGTLVLAMDLMEGGSLRARMGRPWPWREAAALVAELARTLDRCHALGLVHRDVKPENVLFDAQGRARLADLGCARDLTAAALTATGETLGTPPYMAPEQLDGRRVDGRADVWALGVVLHELLAGARPFAAPSPLALLAAISSGARAPRPRDDAPPDLDRALDGALTTDPARRLDAAALAAALEAALRPGARGRRRRTGPAALLVVAAAAGLLAVAWPRPPAPAPPDPPVSTPAVVDPGRASAAPDEDEEDLERLIERHSLRPDDGVERRLLTAAVRGGHLRRADVAAALARATTPPAIDARAACAAADVLARTVEAREVLEVEVLRDLARALRSALARWPAGADPAATNQVLAPLRRVMRETVRFEVLSGRAWRLLGAALQEEGQLRPDDSPPDLAAALLYLHEATTPEEREAGCRRALPHDPLLAASLIATLNLGATPQGAFPAAAREALEALLAAGPPAPEDATWRAWVEARLRMRLAWAGAHVDVPWAARLEHALEACALARSDDEPGPLQEVQALRVARLLAREGIPAAQVAAPPPHARATPGERALVALAWAARGEWDAALALLEGRGLLDVVRAVQAARRARAARGAAGPPPSGE